MFEITDFGRWLKTLKFQHFVKEEFYEEKLIYPVIGTFDLEVVGKWEIMQKKSGKPPESDRNGKTYK